MRAWLFLVWNYLNGRPWFVGAYSAAAGSIGDVLYDEAQNGRLDLSAAGFHKMITMAAIAAILAVGHLYVTPPSKKQ